jgi:cell division protein FtsW (lipid II flippase)
MNNTYNLHVGEKKIFLHGDYLRYKNSDFENTEVLIEKISSVSIKKLKNYYKNIFWSLAGFFASLVSWYFLEENFLNNLLSILCFLGATFFLIAYFVLSNYFLLEINTNRNTIQIEFPINKMNLVEKFKKRLLERIFTN